MDQEQNTNTAHENNSGSAGPLIGAIIILAVILFGALFFWGERSENQELERELQEINSQSDSDEIVDIEADLEATNVDTVDYDLNAENYNAS